MRLTRILRICCIAWVALCCCWRTSLGQAATGNAAKEKRDRVALDPHQRVTGFVRLWSEVKYNFAFFDQVPEVDWDAVLDEYLPKVQQAQSTEEYYRLLRRCMALLRDGHTGIYSVPKSIRKTSFLPLSLAMVDKKVIVVGVAPAAASLQPGLRPGLEITHIDGRDVSEILLRDVYPYVANSTPQNRDRHALRELIAGDKGSEAVVRTRDADGKVKDLKLTRLRWRFPKLPSFDCYQLGGGIVYVALGSFSDKKIVGQFGRAFGGIRDAKGLIIDVRNNGGGSSSIGYAIIGHLIDKPIKGSRWRTREYRPAYRAWGRKETWHKGKPRDIRPNTKTPFLGPVVVLVGPGTVSAAEDFVVALHASGRATIVGAKTAGTTGQPLLIELPGGGKARICTKRDSYPDGREFVGIGVVPDILAEPTQASIAQLQDSPLGKALELLAGKLGIDAAALSPGPALRRRHILAGRDDPVDLGVILNGAKAKYDSLTGAYAKKDWQAVDAEAKDLNRLIRKLLYAVEIDRYQRIRQIRGIPMDQQLEYNLNRATILKRQIESLSADEKGVADMRRLIVQIEDHSDEVHDCIRDDEFEKVPEHFAKLKSSWALFWKRASAGATGK